jgi:hypothetical protein
MLEEKLGNTSEMYLLEPFVSIDDGSNDITHLLQHKAGMELHSLHGALNMGIVGFVCFESMLMPFKSILQHKGGRKVQGNL